jgi:putative flippase GtrA
VSAAPTSSGLMPAVLQRVIDRWPLVGRLMKFGSVGFVAYVVDVTIFNVLLFVGAPPVLEGRPLVAKIISTFAATVVAWLGNRYWTFSTRRSDRPVREFVLFATSCTIGLGVALIPLWISHYVLGFTSPLADNIAANVIGLAMGTTFRFIAYSLVVFPSERARRAGPAAESVSPEAEAAVASEAVESAEATPSVAPPR